MSATIRNRYAVHIKTALQDGGVTNTVLIRTLNGRTGAATSATLRAAAGRVGATRSADHLNPTVGDGGYLLGVMAGVAETNPDAVWAVT